MELLPARVLMKREKRCLLPALPCAEAITAHVYEFHPEAAALAMNLKMF